MAFTYRRFGTLIATWLFFLIQPLLVAVLGKGSALGHLVAIVDIPILLLVGLLGLILSVRDHAAVVRWILIAGGAVLVCGFASDLAAGAPVTSSITGAMLRMKLFLVLGAGLAVRWTPDLATRARKVVVFSAVIVGLSGIFDFVSGGALRTVFADTHTQRLGYVSAGGTFQNLAELNTFMALAFTALLGMTWQNKTSRRLPQVLLVVLAALSTLRLKALVAIPAAAVALAVTSRQVRSRLVLLTALLALAVGALITITHRDPFAEVVDQQVGKYASETTQPRQLLQRVSIEIAHDKFPFGAGFGRFASAPSIEKGNYSPIYRQYGLAKHYGFGPNDPIRFSFDASWPGLLGEVGVLGFLAFAATVVVLTLALFRRSRENNVQADFASIGFAVMIVILVESVGGAAMFQSFILLTAVLFIAPGLWLASGRDRGMR